jgi:hypothetical protein
MTASQVISHTTGDRHVSRFELATVPAPRPTATWYPVPHIDVADNTISALQDAGYTIKSERWTLAKSDQRLFGVVDLSLPLARWDSPGRGASISLGIRSSFDKRLPLAAICGSRVFVCSNLAFSGEVGGKHKHTRNGLNAFRGIIEDSIRALPAFQAIESARYESYMQTRLTPDQQAAIILALIDSGIVGMRSVRAVLDELKSPTYQDFAGEPTVWTLMNIVTTALRSRSNERVQEFSVQSSRLLKALDGVARFKLDENVVKPLALTFDGD